MKKLRHFSILIINLHLHLLMQNAVSLSTKLNFPTPYVLSNGSLAMVCPYHLWVYLDDHFLHYPGSASTVCPIIVRYGYNPRLDIKKLVGHMELKLKFVKFSSVAFGAAIYVSPHVIILLNTRTFSKYIFKR